MTASQAIEIRERARDLGLQKHCEECASDMELLEMLSNKGAMVIVPATHPDAILHSQRKEPVLGSALENAARRLRRAIGASKAS